ncbi:DmsC/YnfH family molybdoenzyme membrane anchor subunit [Cypionkella sp.]|uniref:dimethyl sulfoxide reductase anchor subunit family protein n=1 Tax=Cypionkella sp. TaxID=2811411 RepID=UPI00271F38F6|nr:DmsC/YnfH family molybdoenzyme membrane anchor subunit [Cypionkella sp.]MDO8982791.1 DmsC/YnfH family molybdoenzyme membrane anchor subunit [Cypionkella sp.]MDP2049539.1 DmsC/YnfH family molybdoenzyme membrane anchor subunit [Cypionkella sp.]
MHPAPSVIVFSVLSGAGFGLLFFLGLGFVHPSGLVAFLWWGLGYGLAVIGLLASTFHLGNPKRAWRAFTQWQTSWLSREAWASVAALVLLAPMALSDWLDLGLPRPFGWLGAALALVTVFTTSMIYAQIKAVPRWHHWLTPVMFLSFALAGGAVLAGQSFAAVLLSALAAVLLAIWQVGDGQFARRAQTLGTATGLDRIGEVTVFEQAHTAGNYLLREMIFVVGRKHAQKLRAIALALAAVIPAALLVISGEVWTFALAAICHLIGALTARWLFFAQAEHVVGLFYGKR